ncbi:MAG: Xaa-Pro dipeptidase, partial [Pseudoxanthomonas sp.]
MTPPDFNALYAEHLATMKRRADEALSRSGYDHLVVPSGTQHYQVFDDRDYPYAVNPQFKAWLPLTRVPYSWLVYTPGKRPQVIFYQPFDYWHVVPDAPSGWWVEHFDIHIIRKPEEAQALLPKPAVRCAILGEAQSALGAAPGEHYVANNPAPAIDYLEYQRSYKTPYEIALMREAQHLAVQGHRAAEAAFREGKSEFAIHMAYCAAVGQDLGELPYNNIVALNEHGAVLHSTELDRTAPAPVRSFVIDAGASSHGYASDITRTSAMDTAGEFQALIDAVDRAQIGMGKGVRAGADYKQLHIDAHLT